MLGSEFNLGTSDDDVAEGVDVRKSCSSSLSLTSKIVCFPLERNIPPLVCVDGIPEDELDCWGEVVIAEEGGARNVAA